MLRSSLEERGLVGDHVAYCHLRRRRGDDLTACVFAAEYPSAGRKRASFSAHVVDQKDSSKRSAVTHPARVAIGVFEVRVAHALDDLQLVLGDWAPELQGLTDRG